MSDEARRLQARGAFPSTHPKAIIPQKSRRMTRSQLSPITASGPRMMIVLGAVAILLLAWIATSPVRAAERCGGEDARVLAHSGSGRITLGGATRTVRLSATCGPIGPAIKRSPAKARFFLVIEDLRASTQPGAIFDIALAPPGGRLARHMLGTLNFFNAHPAAAGKGRRGELRCDRTPAGPRRARAVGVGRRAGHRAHVGARSRFGRFGGGHPAGDATGRLGCPQPIALVASRAMGIGAASWRC